MSGLVGWTACCYHQASELRGRVQGVVRPPIFRAVKVWPVNGSGTFFPACDQGRGLKDGT